jgi:AcrR family transcriptional regulator
VIAHKNSHAVHERGKVSRARIIDIAAELFARRGYRGTGLAAIAEEAGITPSGILHHFGSKDALLMEVLTTHYIGHVPGLEQAYERHTLKGLQDLFDAVADGVISREGLARLFSVVLAENLSREDPAHKHFVSRYANHRQTLTAWFEQAKRDGLVKADLDPQLIAAEMLAFMDGIQLQWLLEPGAIDLKAAYRNYVRGLLNRISTKALR